jgi:hypothetical protein
VSLYKTGHGASALLVSSDFSFGGFPYVQPQANSH